MSSWVYYAGLLVYTGLGAWFIRTQPDEKRFGLTFALAMSIGMLLDYLPFRFDGVDVMRTVPAVAIAFRMIWFVGLVISSLLMRGVK